MGAPCMGAPWAAIEAPMGFHGVPYWGSTGLHGGSPWGIGGALGKHLGGPLGACRGGEGEGGPLGTHWGPFAASLGEKALVARPGS